MPDKKTFQGSCHCGKVRYEVDATLEPVISCNCSMCSKKGSLLTFVADGDFRLQSGEENLTDYMFHKHVIHHLFCKTCGITSFARGKRPDGVEMVAINVRCLEGVDVGSLVVKQVDGRSF